MKTQILPNWCKKLGLILFIVASLFNGSINFITNSINKLGLPGINTDELGEQSSYGIVGLLNAFTAGYFSYGIGFLAIIAVLVYMISKEKVEDDYINKLRLESFQLTFIIGLITTIVFYILDKNLKLTLDYFIFPLLWSYIILFFIKRRMYI